MEASSVLAQDEAVGAAPLRPLNEKGNDAGAGAGAGAGGAAVESGNRERVVEGFRHTVDNLISKADELEQKVNEIVRFYASKKQPSNSKGSSVMKDKDKEKSLGINNGTSIGNNSGSNGSAKKLVDGSRKEVVCSKRMQELMRQFGTILKQAS